MKPAPASDSDEELARATQAGSLAAFEELVRRYHGRIHGFLAKLCRSDADAREVTQDSFVRAFQAIGQFDPGRAFAPWLFTIARRRCIDHHRARPPEPAGPLPEPLDEDDPARQLARTEDGRQLWALARRSLPPLQFQALWLRYADDFSVAETAQVLGKSRTHVKVLLFRARLTLSGALESAGAGPEASRQRGPAGQSTPLPAPFLPGGTKSPFGSPPAS